jgi:hypothetical protein
MVGTPKINPKKKLHATATTTQRKKEKDESSRVHVLHIHHKYHIKLN